MGNTISIGKEQRLTSDSNGGISCPRRGRPRLRRTITSTSESCCYKPCCCPEREGTDISLHPDEIESTRLIDLEGLEQEEVQKRSASRARPRGATCTKHVARLPMHSSTGRVSRWRAAGRRQKGGARNARDKTPPHGIKPDFCVRLRTFKYNCSYG